jgi:hypothetical protein
MGFFIVGSLTLNQREQRFLAARAGFLLSRGFYCRGAIKSGMMLPAHCQLDIIF